MNLWNSYYRAQSIDDALDKLANAVDPTCVVAGGTDLLLDMQQGRHASVDLMVDVTHIPEMQVIEVRENQLFIGGAVPINRIVQSPLVNEHAAAVVEACDLIGGPQVRNTATLGGNVAHALPAADGTISLVAMGAEVEIANSEGRNRFPIQDLFLGPGKSLIKTGQEILVGFYLLLRQTGQASAFHRVMRPQGVALPILNSAAWVWREKDVVKDVRIAVGPAGPTPRRSINAETILRGQKFCDSVVDKSIKALLSESQFRTSPLRASSSYRKHLAEKLVQTVLETAWSRTAIVEHAGE